MFYHSLLSDWNHGNAHFLRGVVRELLRRGHQVEVYEPLDSWSLQNLLSEHGPEPIRKFHQVYCGLQSHRYPPERFALETVLNGADLVIVHEWNRHELVRRIGAHRKSTGGYRLLFHDTHHRLVTDPRSMQSYDLRHYDGVLAYGRVLRDLYLDSHWVAAAWVWHEAADTSVFFPQPKLRHAGDLVWVGNWGDEERTSDLHEFLIEPVRNLQLKASIHGVRYPQPAIESLGRAGIDYKGWLPNFEAPGIFAQFDLTVHVPRRPYVEALPGIPTIRVFEALACGIPLVCSPWHDVENLFTPGRDFLMARNGREMQDLLRALLQDKAMAGELSRHGLATIHSRHTCSHRIDELLAIVQTLKGENIPPLHL